MKPDDLSANDEASPLNSGDSAGGPPLLARKSVLMGIAASLGTVSGAIAQPSTVATVKALRSGNAAGSPAYAAKWAPFTAYRIAQQIISPNNDVASAKMSHISSAAYVTDTVRWNLSRSYAEATEHGVNALKNGCAGDGVTDDTAALHAVRDVAAKLGVSVFLPRATYLTTGLTLNKAHQSWILAKGSSIVLKSSSPHDVVTIRAVGVSVAGGKLDGNRTNQAEEYSGFMVDAPNATISGVETTNCFGNGISLGPTATGCLIEGNYCHDNGKDTNAASGIYLREATLCRVVGNRCENNGTAGNEIHYDGNGIYLAGGAITGHNVVANNQCNNNARRGIKVQEAGATIVGNSLAFNSTGIGVTVENNPTRTPTVISGNLISGSLLQGLQLDNCSFISVSGNTIIDSGDHGVGAALNCHQVTFANNVIARSARNGVNIQGAHDWNITGNIVLDNGQALVNRNGFLLEDDDSPGPVRPCKNINVVGNISQNTDANTTQNAGFVVTGTSDRISLFGNSAENGLIYPYSFDSSVTNLATFGNRGGGAGFTSIGLVPGASVDADHKIGFTICSDAGRKVGFWGKPPVAQPAAPPADATDLATAIALVNDLKAKLKLIGLLA